MRAGRGWLAATTGATQWAVLTALSLVLVAIALGLRIPAATMVGPMLAAIFVAVAEARIRIAPIPFIAAQGIIGCMVGSSIPLTVFSDIARDWPLFVFAIAATLAAASGVGYVLTRRNFLPGTTAIWGISPGASTPMIVMSEEYGADPRLVAVMQMLRIACVIGVAAIVARIWAPDVPVAGSAQARATVWFPSLPLLGFAVTLAISVGAAFVAQWLRIPAGTMLVPTALALIVHEMSWVEVVLPPWLLALSYGLIGWNIGLRFTRPILAHAFMALPRIVVSTLTLIALCGAIAAVLVVAGGIDPLTAYLATSPGGMDSVAIIAAASNRVNISFVMALQLARFLLVLIAGPPLARLLARHVGD